MRIFIAALILIISLQSWTKADDIRDFEIEGMSIGDSALNFFSEKQIEANKYFAYPLKDYFQSFIMTPDSQMYTSIQFSIKNGDNDFIIASIEGGVHPIEFNKCKKRKKIVEKQILEVFPDLTNVIYGEERKMWSDPDSKEITTDIYLNTSFTDGGAIRIICVDRSKRIEEEKGWVDSLRVIANSKEFNIFIDKNTSLND
jgi:hypothetical protein